MKGEPDIPGIPPGNADDGINYFLFLDDLREALPDGLSISIAAPASFWYLRGFPIVNIGNVVDYTVYMTCKNCLLKLSTVRFISIRCLYSNR